MALGRAYGDLASKPDSTRFQRPWSRVFPASLHKRDDERREATRVARTGRRSYLTITYIATDER